MAGSQRTLEGIKLYLRPITTEDVNDEYIAWLNDTEVSQFLESRFERHTLESSRVYVDGIIKNLQNVFLAIVRKDTNKHIGNIKLGPIDPHHKIASIGLMIGDKNSWGKGFATEAIQLLIKYAFEVLNLHKVTAGAYENNIGSIKAFLKLGFFEEGRRKKHFLSKGVYVDYVLLAKFNENQEA